jgi:hypothetical protein
MNCRTLLIPIAILACQFTFSGRAEAATAHCLGNIRDTSGQVIVDLGTVATYKALFPQNSNHQEKCVQAVSKSASSWLKNPGQMCHAFLAANGGDLIFHYKLGSLKWRASGHATDARIYNYPKSCFGLSGSVFPSYYIITLIYTPPGCTPSTSSAGYKCGSGSSVSYGSGSSAGSTVSIKNSTGTSTSLTAKLDSVLSISGGYSETSASGSSVTISKATNNVLTWPSPGPAGPDGINHDLDQFLILLNPAVAISGWHDPITGQNHAQWSLGTKNGAPMRIQRVQVSYLRCALAGIGPRPGNSGNGGGPSIYDPTGSCSANPYLQMQGPPNASASNGWLPGLTYDDYKQILAQDLFWNASPTNRILIPTSRFVPQSTDFTYDQAGGPQGASCAVQQQSISNSNTATNTSSTETQYQASMSLSPGFPIGPTKLDLTSTMSLTWKNETSSSLTKANSQSATATVGCTSINWTGPNFVTAYYDTLYGTFLFALDDGTGRAKVLQGTITDMDGDLVPHEPLKLVISNKTYQTFSHNDGSFRFYLPAGQTSAGAVTGTLFVGSGGKISKSVSVGPQATVTATIPTPAPSLSVALGTPPRPINNQAVRMETPTVPGPTPIYIAVTNQSLFTTAKNVMVTSIQATSQTGSRLVYSGKLPFTVPGGTALKAGDTTSFPLTFTNVTGPLSFLSVTVKADNLAPFSTVLTQPFRDAISQAQLDPGQGSLVSRPISSKPSAAQKVAQAGWRVEVEEGKSTRATLTINNRCSAPHLFSIKSKAKGLSFEQQADKVLIGASSSKVITALFDAKGLKSKVYRSKVVIECLDCKTEPRCTQDRDELHVEMTVNKSSTRAKQIP